MEAINRELSKRKSFRAADVQRYLEFDCSKHIRLLVRLGFLEVIPGQEEGERARFQRRSWPPPAGFFEGDGTVIGLAYYIQKWFKYALQGWIARHSREIEAKAGIYSLEDWTATGGEFLDKAHNGTSDYFSMLDQVVRPDGNYRNSHGDLLEVDLGMIEKPLDISEMTLDWVRSTDDPLFADLERSDRHLLYLVFVRDMDRHQIAESLGWQFEDVSKNLQRVLGRLKTQVQNQLELV